MSEGPSSGATPPGVGGESGPARPKGGSHRAARSPFALVLPILVVAASVVAVGVGVYGWVTALEQPQELADVPVVSQPTGSGSPSPGSSHSPKPSKSPKATHSPTASTSPKQSKPASSSPASSHSAKPSKSATATAHPVSRVYPVVVLNQTSVTGLAAATAADLTRVGWTVTGVGNWRGNLVQTTVYYPPGQYAQAQQLARDVGTDRIRPRVSPMRGDRLTVILAGRG